MGQCIKLQKLPATLKPNTLYTQLVAAPFKCCLKGERSIFSQKKTQKSSILKIFSSRGYYLGA